MLGSWTFPSKLSCLALWMRMFIVCWKFYIRSPFKRKVIQILYRVVFLHPYSETPWNDQLTKETLVERTIRATNHAKATLMAGFTTVRCAHFFSRQTQFDSCSDYLFSSYRDLGTEGAGDADIALRRCLSGRNALIPGPRYFCANRAIVSRGSYGPFYFPSVTTKLSSPVYALDDTL